MIGRRPFSSLLLLALCAAPAWAQPRQNLLVELRWVESGVSGAAIAGTRQGGVVVGTAGSVSPRPGGISLSTRRVEEGVEAQQQVLVLNGATASVMLAETELLQWLDYGVALRGGGGPGQAPPRAQVYAQSRSLPIERRRGFALTPSWPGGRQPVRVELRALAPAGAAGEAEILSTVQVALGEWMTVARRGGVARSPQPGVISSSDAETQSMRELQIRVQPAP
ncbi:hypothetical protein G8A07_03465 [Roseateles sp. DAIF2]|uniref:hypothetical protein n=1 Tax=Roseateles sp. DAIF2 TaxID=2714952 RepID=UPI0018A2AB44|nr:hypothetical protein [Roseateles sp. DAIF2]QPF72080.1 hypothetical protein G8A07_03465 [Roseateles sp. DAIF2]